MSKKLIDWATAPKGIKAQEIMTGLIGALLETDGKKACLHFSGVYDLGLYDCRALAIAPADQQPWLLYEEGVTVIPEWAVCEFDGLMRFYSEDDATYATKTTDPLDLLYIKSYKLGNAKGEIFKEGWTDKPEEVTE